MLALAKKFRITSGKWTFPIDWSGADESWRKLVQGLLDGDFPDELGVIYVRIYGRERPENNPHSAHKGRRTVNAMITIGTLDWTDQKSTMKAASIARQLGLDVDFKYKPDIYSALEIFRNNVYDLKPTIYQLLRHEPDSLL